ncbi:protein containg haem-binding domain [Longilinea arvoryzae]|uniref:Protein containg haem-binding domain n=1 Tax=Longilinea arvoryzae TaxID=360412 RepID=A0A0S7BI17_9CHLR|nr:heme-binding domain-containing protein [Longilinea arvoryzae]GAP14243.1 protein containg haem-binding domain [Longilinea arvoryzae]
MVKKSLPAWIKWASLLIGAFLLIQLIPYGKAHTNPPVTGEPKWQDAATADLVKRACYDCHSNETVWPWYSSVAPASWLIQHDVDEARQIVNFSNWNAMSGRDVDRITRVIQEGEMPPIQFTLIHAEARLSNQEKAQLISGLSNSLAAR